MIKDIFCPATIASLLVLGACASRFHEPNESYVLVAAHTRIPYWQEAFAGLRRAGAEMHVKVDMVGPDRYDPKVEREVFQSVIGDKPSGILISPADPNLMAADIDSALQQGIPVLTIDSDAPTSKRLFFIGSDNYATGRLGAQFLVKLLAGKGNIVMFTYPQANLMERRQGYESVLENYPDIQVTQAVDIHGDPAIAYNTAKQLLTSKAQVNAFVCLEAVACPEVGEAVNDTNTAGKVTIMAMDTDQRTLNWIRQGLVAATIAQKPYTMAYLGVKLLDDLHHHKRPLLETNFRQDPFSPYPTSVFTGTFLVGKENLNTFTMQKQPPANGATKP